MTRRSPRASRVLAVIALALCASVAAPAASGQKPGKKPPGARAISIAAPSAIVFGSTGSITGKLTGKDHQSQRVTLEGDAYPYSTFRVRATTVTDAQGHYRFAVSPRVNTRYRVRVATAPAVTSTTVVVKVRFRVSLSLSDSTPRSGSLVRFSGSARPARDGRRVSIQKLSSRGTFFTVARTRLRDAGTSRSRYSKRARISRTGVYRVKVFADGSNATGYSRSATVTVH